MTPKTPSRVSAVVVFSFLFFSFEALNFIYTPLFTRPHGVKSKTSARKLEIDARSLVLIENKHLWSVDVLKRHILIASCYASRLSGNVWKCTGGGMDLWIHACMNKLLNGRKPLWPYAATSPSFAHQSGQRYPLSRARNLSPSLHRSTSSLPVAACSQLLPGRLDPLEPPAAPFPSALGLPVCLPRPPDTASP